MDTLYALDGSRTIIGLLVDSRFRARDLSVVYLAATLRPRTGIDLRWRDQERSQYYFFDFIF